MLDIPLELFKWLWQQSPTYWEVAPILVAIAAFIVFVPIYAIWRFFKHDWKELETTPLGKVINSASGFGLKHPGLGWGLAIVFILISLTLALHAIRVELQPRPEPEWKGIIATPTLAPTSIPTLTPSLAPTKVPTMTPTLPPPDIFVDTVDCPQYPGESNGFMRHKSVLPIPNAQAKYGYLVEFGASRYPTEGLNIGLNLGTEFEYRVWFDKPCQFADYIEKSAITGFDGKIERNPATVFRVISDKEFISQTKSMYVYFQSNSEFNLDLRTVQVKGRYE